MTWYVQCRNEMVDQIVRYPSRKKSSRRRATLLTMAVMSMALVTDL